MHPVNARAASGSHEAQPLRWLHLSDLHVGCRGRDAWWQVLDQFWRSLDEWLAVLAAPDMVLLTGDLTFKGDRGEFDELSKFLDELLRRLPRDAGGRPPLVVAVPGNHDLERPKGEAALVYAAFDRHDLGDDDMHVRFIGKKLWEERDMGMVQTLFTNYVEWCEHVMRPLCERPGVELVLSKFPGDLWLTADLPGRFPLAIVGLNSAWLQYREGDFLRKLAVPREQFHMALPARPGESPLRAFDSVHRALLMMHHPHEWLDLKQQATFAGEIHVGERFDAFLHGHMHVARAESIARQGGARRYTYQSPSLFGVEHYGTSRESRAIGYTWGALHEDGALQLWPLELQRKGDDGLRFDRDRSFHWQPGTEGLRERQGDGRRWPQSEPSGPAHGSPRAEPDTGSARIVVGEPAALPVYRAWLARQEAGVRLIGLGGGDVTLSLDAVYVPLRAMAYEDRGRVGPQGALGELAGDEPEPVDFTIDRLFHHVKPRHNVLLGEPGSGKTTALHKLFHTCAREPAEQLGLAAGTVPVALQLRRFTADRKGQPLARWLQDELTAASAGALPPELGAALWAHRRLVVLADGLDELFTEDQRAALAQYLSFQLTGAANEHVRAVVSCRRAGYHQEFARDPNFGALELRPLQPPHVRTLVQQWFAEAARKLDILSADAQESSKSLIDALEGSAYATQRLRVMVSTPLLLTLLCVIVHQGRPLPRSRVEYYERCLEVLLLRWGQEHGRREPPLDLERAKAVLRPLAYTLHMSGEHKAKVRGTLAKDVNVLLRRRGLAEDGFAVVDWLERDAGVLQEFERGCLGFAHLGLQEYLAAAHIVAEGSADIEALAGRIDDPWWHEVARLAAAQPGAFVPLMRGVLQRPLEQGELIADLLDESNDAEPSPLLARLATVRTPAEGATILRLLQRFAGDAAVVAAAKACRDDPSAEVQAEAVRLLAGRTTRDCPVEQVVLVFAEDDRAAAEQYARRLRGRVEVFMQGGRLLDAATLNRNLGAAAKVAACVLVLHRRPDPDIRGCLDYLGDIGKRLACVLLAGAAPPVWAPGDGPVPSFAWDDVGALLGWHAKFLARAVHGIADAQPFTDPWAGIRFLPVPGDRFQMGMAGIAEPVHWVRLQPYWLAEVPVTNAQYATFLAENPGYPEPDYWRERRFSGGEQPVVGVRWADAMAFCVWLSRCPGLADTVEIQLPSEAQWEFAARGTEGRRFPWGKELPDRSRAVFSRMDGTARVGSCPAGAGPFGHLDLAGNVWELCRDGWRPDAYAERTGGDAFEPQELANSDGRVVRGDCWFGDGSWLSPAIRHCTPLRRRDALTGFRPAAVRPRR